MMTNACKAKANLFLNGFKSLQFVHGTSQSFDFFYLINHTKRFRGFKGDFMYHKIMWKKGYEWKHIEDGEIERGDAVIFSLPFSDFGSVHPRTNEILDKCDELGVPVFLDCAYMIMARNIEFDFNRKCIGLIVRGNKNGYCVGRLPHESIASQALFKSKNEVICQSNCCHLSSQ